MPAPPMARMLWEWVVVVGGERCGVLSFSLVSFFSLFAHPIGTAVWRPGVSPVRHVCGVKGGWGSVSTGAVIFFW